MVNEFLQASMLDRLPFVVRRHVVMGCCRPDVAPKGFHVSSHIHKLGVVIGREDQWIAIVLFLQAQEVSMIERILPFWSAKCCGVIVLSSYRAPVPAVL